MALAADSSKHCHPNLASFQSFLSTRPLVGGNVTLDGMIVKVGNANQASIDYFTHSKTLGGIINRLPPTD